MSKTGGVPGAVNPTVDLLEGAVLREAENEIINQITATPEVSEWVGGWIRLLSEWRLRERERERERDHLADRS